MTAIKTKSCQPSPVLSIDMDPDAWDHALGRLGGHPLQSSRWGNLRVFPDQRIAIVSGGVPIWMARIEERRIPGLGRVAWIPKGPTASHSLDAVGALPNQVVSHLKNLGYILAITDPFVELAHVNILAGNYIGPATRTIWVDLKCDETVAFGKLDKKWRNGVRRSKKEGVIVETTQTPDDISQFLKICQGISKMKGFALGLDQNYLENLLKPHGHSQYARLYVAKKGEVILGGAVILISGTNWHYFWGGTDRAYSQLRPGEAVQWQVILDGIRNGATRYDLEGVDEKSNPGTAAFKSKMGGRLVQLVGKRAHPLNFTGDGIRLALRIWQKLKASRC